MTYAPTTTTWAPPTTTGYWTTTYAPTTTTWPYAPTTTTAAPTTTAPPTTTAAPTTAATGIFFNQGCDLSTEKYLTNSPGVVPSLTVCIQLCEESAQCISITFHTSQWCSHFGSACSNKVGRSATAVVLPPRSYTASWALVGVFGTQCDFSSGEVYMRSSSARVGSLSDCLDSCEATAGCRSAIFYYNSNWCSHASTACTATMKMDHAVAFSKPSSSVTTMTTKAPTPVTTKAPTPVTTKAQTSVTTPAPTTTSGVEVVQIEQAT